MGKKGAPLIEKKKKTYDTPIWNAIPTERGRERKRESFQEEKDRQEARGGSG